MNRKPIAVLLAALMLIAIVPMSALAQDITAQAAESRRLALLDDAWEPIEAVEAEAAAKKASPVEVTKAAYNAALNESVVDKGSLVWKSDVQFAFTVDGMHCVYYYPARLGVDENVPGSKSVVSFGTKAGNAAGASDVLLVGPYYGVQSTFTDQYKEEANSIAETTGGARTMLSGSEATGPAIAQNYTDKGVVIYDSHGTQSGTSSYLCLTTNAGITSEDYNNGWAVSSGSAAYIDGRYIQNHASGTLSNCMVWMAICEGMKSDGYGTTGTALLAAGAGVVYGYSQSVSFTGDYEYEAHFWNNMKNNGTTVAEAFDAMTSELQQWDPAYSSSSGNAWPIVMSPLDPFPSNPDSHQTVNCDWTLLGGDPVALESFELCNTSGETVEEIAMAMGKSFTVRLVATPSNANNYTVEWSVADTSVATVEGSGKTAKIKGVSVGSTTLTATVTTESKAVYTDTVNVTVTEAPKWNPTDDIVPGEEYLIGFIVDGVTYLAVNYNVSASNHYYNSVSSNYYGYTAPAVMNGESVIGVSGNAEDLDYCIWKFENVSGGHITSGYESNVYLQAYSGSSYADLYPGTSNNYSWTYDAGEHTLYTYTTENRYAQYVSNGGNFMGVTGSIPENSSVQLYSVSAPEPDPDATYYTVTFVDWDGTVLKTESVREGYNAHAPADPVRVGYTFTGWDVDFTNVTSDITVTATYEVYVAPVYEWVPTDTIVPGEEYLIGFVSGDTTYLAVNYNPGASNHYYNSVNATYYGFTAPATIEGGKVVGVTGAVDDLIYCAWTFSTANGGLIRSAYQDNYYLVTWSSASYNDLYPKMAEAGYYWTWDSAAHTLYRTIDNTLRYAGYVNVSGSDQMQVTSTVPDSSIQLYVKQEVTDPVEPTYYTVTFVDNLVGGTIAEVTVEEGAAAAAPAVPTHPGYHFTGWSEDFSAVTSDMTVYALYAINTYTVTFLDWDGKVIDEQTVEHGSAAAAPADPEREGYNFIGWDADFSNVTGDMTVTAQYELIPVPAVLTGDVNCDGVVTASDISSLFAYVMNAGSLSEQALLNADIDGNGTVDATDASLLAQMVFGA